MENIKNQNNSIEEMAANYLDEDKRKAFFDFYTFLTDNKIGKRKSGKYTCWAFTYKRKRIFTLSFHENSWGMLYFNLHQKDKWFEKMEKHLTPELTDFILSHINTEFNCCVKEKCNAIENRVILGKLFENRTCACSPIGIYNPEGEELEYAKKLALLGKKIIAETVANDNV
ncbi:MAG: hypothetical protein ACLU62_10145 [Hydrogeniiclostridium sp.]